MIRLARRQRRRTRMMACAFACCCITGPTGCRDSPGPSNLPVGPTAEGLWKATVGRYLAAPLWSAEEAYDAGHYLMAPLHAAFRLGHTRWQAAFSEHFGRFVREWGAGAAGHEIQLGQLQYLYLAAEFLALAGPRAPTLIPEPLPGLLQTEVRRAWEEGPAWQWGRAPFPGGVRERLLWKLSTPSTVPSYYRAVLGEELFLLAIAADLKRYSDVTGWPGLDSALVDDVLRTGALVFRQRVVWQGGGWLFQPGVWADHSDYAYAGHSSIRPNLHPAPLPEVAEDVSHSHRFPLWLQSLEAAFPPGTPERVYFQQLRAGLGAQFFGRVLRWPVPRTVPISTSNYMDGRDGVYRWGYATVGPGRGYGPSELSGTLTLGWWAFLPHPEGAALYRELADRFPLDSATVALYVGPNTSRVRNPLVALPASYSNGFMELLVRLAAELAPGVSR